MSDFEYMYTDLRLDKLEYTMEEMIGADQTNRCVSLDGSPVLGVRFQETSPGRSRLDWDEPFLALVEYRVIHGAAYFEYNKRDEWKKSDRMCLGWLMSLIQNHLRCGAKKFYYAHLWESNDPDIKKPRTKKIDLATFRPSDKKFEFGRHTVYEFIDSSIKK